MKFKTIAVVQSLVLLTSGFAFAVEGDAAKTYAAKCASCHAKDGKGNPAMAKVFKVEPAKLSLVSQEVQDKKDADLVKVTTDGVGKMPAYKGKLSETEIAAQVAFIRSLAPKK